jgi:hypothetical protein
MKTTLTLNFIENIPDDLPKIGDFLLNIVPVLLIFRADVDNFFTGFIDSNSNREYFWNILNYKTSVINLVNNYGPPPSSPTDFLTQLWKSNTERIKINIGDGWAPLDSIFPKRDEELLNAQLRLTAYKYAEIITEKGWNSF